MATKERTSSRRRGVIRSESAAESGPRRTSAGRKSIVQPPRADELERAAFAQIGRVFRETRLQQGLTLDALAEKVKLETHGYIITGSQISRIESGRRDPGFFNTKVIASALRIPLRELSSDLPAYGYYLFTPERMRQLLAEHLADKLPTSRHDGKHQLMIGEGLYRPIPLEPRLASKWNEVFLENSMSINLLRVEEATFDQMMRPDALDSHDGEEVIFVVEGEVEFFFVQTPRFDPRAPLDLKREPVSAGGCLHYTASALHGFRAIGGAPALALYVASKPRAYIVKDLDEELGHGRK